MKKKVLIILIVIVVMSLSAGAIAFAAETEVPTKEERQELQEKREEIAVKRYSRLHWLFETYYPEGVEALEENKEAHVEFHESAQENREELRASIKESFTEIKEAFENGDIDRTEARTQIVALKSTIEEMRTEFKAVIDVKRTAQQEVKDSLITLREEMKDLLGNDEVDAVRVGELLADTLPLLEQHVENDVFYHGQFLDIVEHYGF